MRARLPGPPGGQVWIGDDAAVVSVGSTNLLLSADAVVAGVHFDLELVSLEDVGWKALAVNLSDIAAMGGTPGHALVTVVLPGGTDLERLYEGLGEAADRYECPIVGGDLASGPNLVVSVAVTGTVDGAPVLRSGAEPGDALMVTGPLGGSAAGLRELQAGGDGPGHRRPRPRVAEGAVARQVGVTAMIDLSDGLVLDLRRLAEASGVGVIVDEVPVAPSATNEEALAGGEDYELLFTTPDPAAVAGAFESAGLPAPVTIGRCTADPDERRLGEAPLPEGGWEHRW